MIRGRFFTLRTLRLVAGILSAPIAANQMTQASAQVPGQAAADVAHLAALRKNSNEIWNRYVSLGGYQAILDIQYRIALRASQAQRIEERLGDLSGSTEALERMRKQVEQTWIFGLDDVVQQGGQKIVEKGTKAALESSGKAAASKALAWIGAIANVVEYGGKKIIKEINIDRLDELIKQNRINLSDALHLQSALFIDNNKDRKRLNELLDLKAHYEQAYHRYWLEKERRKNPTNTHLPNCTKEAQSNSDHVLDAAIRDLRAAKQEIFKAIESAPRYGGKFAFLLKSGNFYDVHLRKLASVIRLWNEKHTFDCDAADAVRAGIYRIQVLTRRLQLFIEYNKRNKRILQKMIAEAQSINAGTYF